MKTTIAVNKVFMSKGDDKTNVMRILDRKKINYQCVFYDSTLTNAVEVAKSLGENPAMVFKTLVTVGKSNEHYVFIVPSEKELDLKKAAQAAGEKSVEMIPLKELLPLTGYIHGGCSPIGMKKEFKTFIDTSAEKFKVIFFSAGRIGIQIKTSLDELKKVIPVICVDIAKN